MPDAIIRSVLAAMLAALIGMQGGTMGTKPVDGEVAPQVAEAERYADDPWWSDDAGDDYEDESDDYGESRPYVPDSGTLPAGAKSLVAVCREELALWEAGEVDYHRYKDPFEQNPADGGWCGMFVGFCAGRIGSSCINWQGDAFPGDTTWPGGYHDYYVNNPDMGYLYDAGEGVVPKPGDIVIMWGGAHVELVEEVDPDGSGYWCISGGGSVDHNYHEVGSDSVTWFVTPNWDAIG